MCRYSWRFEDRTSDARVAIRWNYHKYLNMRYTLHTSRSSPIQNPLSWWIFDPVQSKSAWTGLDYESSGLIQSIPYSGRHTYTGFQHFLGQAQLLYAMCVEKRKRSNNYTNLTILSLPSQTALPINHQRVHCKALPFVFLHHPVQILPVPAKESASAMRHSGTEMLQL